MSSAPLGSFGKGGRVRRDGGCEVDERDRVAQRRSLQRGGGRDDMNADVLQAPERKPCIGRVGRRQLLHKSAYGGARPARRACNKSLFGLKD